MRSFVKLEREKKILGKMSKRQIFADIKKNFFFLNSYENLQVRPQINDFCDNWDFIFGTPKGLKCGVGAALWSELRTCTARYIF